jgi:hypothetical protein
VLFFLPVELLAQPEFKIKPVPPPKKQVIKLPPEKTSHSIRIKSFTATPPRLRKGQTSTLSIRVLGDIKDIKEMLYTEQEVPKSPGPIRLKSGSGPISPRTRFINLPIAKAIDREVKPSVDTIYQLTVTDSEGNVAKSSEVLVDVVEPTVLDHRKKKPF